MYDEFKQLLEKALDVIRRRHIPHAVTITLTPSDTIAAFGDIHGDFETFQSGLEKARSHHPTYIVFMGDYVDKGKDSVRSFSIALKEFINDPVHVIPLVGNHEQFLCFGLAQQLKDPALIALAREVIDNMPICCYATGGGRNYYFAHGGYPFMYRKKYIHVDDHYEDVWKHLNKVKEEPSDKDAVVYETNVGMNPAEYVNSIFDEMKELAVRPVESPYLLHAYEKYVADLDAIKNELSKSSPDSSVIKEHSDSLTKDERYYFSFTSYIKMWKQYQATYERTCERLINIRYYVGWSDMYVFEEMDKARDPESYLALLKRAGTDYINHVRFEVHRPNLCYPESQLKKWMNDNKINAIIRGHEFKVTECNVRDINKGTEQRSPPSVKVNDDSRMYVCIHSTRSYADDTYPELTNAPKFVIVGRNEITVHGC